MAPFIRIPNSVGVNVRFTIDGKPSEFGFTVELPTAPVLSTMQTLGSTVVDWVFNSVKPLFTSFITFNDVYLTDLNDVTGPAFAWTLGTGSDNMPFSGSHSGTPQQVSNQAALVASYRTGNRGRSYRGRTYFPIVDNSNLSDALTVTSGFASAILSAVNDLEADVEFLGDILVVPSRFSGGAARSVGLATPITEFIVNTRIDTQRRRVKS